MTRVTLRIPSVRTLTGGRWVCSQQRVQLGSTPRRLQANPKQMFTSLNIQVKGFKLRKELKEA